MKPQVTLATELERIVVERLGTLAGAGGKYLLVAGVISVAIACLPKKEAAKTTAHRSWPDAYENAEASGRLIDNDSIIFIDIDTAFLYTSWYRKQGLKKAVRYFYNDSMNSKMTRTFHANGMLWEHADKGSSFRDPLNPTGVGCTNGLSVDFWDNGPLFHFYYFDDKCRMHGNAMTVDPDGTLRENEVYNHGKILRAYYYSKSGALDSMITYPENEARKECALRISELYSQRTGEEWQRILREWDSHHLETEIDSCWKLSDGQYQLMGRIHQDEYRKGVLPPESNCMLWQAEPVREHVLGRGGFLGTTDETGHFSIKILPYKYLLVMESDTSAMGYLVSPR